jgi:exopolysaccharide production protein ExoQ
MTPVDTPTAADLPSTTPTDHPSPTALWVLTGQLGVQVALFLGFGVLPLPSPNMVAASTLALAGATVLLAPHGQIGRIRLHLAPLALLWWWMLSLLWTADPAQWWVDSMSNVPIVVATLLVVGMLPRERIVRALLAFVHVTIAFQVLWIATHPGEATANRDLLTGAVTAGWRGSFIHKNALGPFLVVALLTVLLLERRRALRWFTATVIAGLLAMTQSVTAWWVTIVIGAFVGWLGWYSTTRPRVRAAVVVPSIVLGGLALVGVARVYPVIVDAYGKDLTFSGRTVIWTAALRAIEQRPVSGYGIGGVWFRPHDEPARSIIADAGFTVFHTHNGYIELVLLLGAVGLALWLSIVSTTLVAAWRALDADRPTAVWGLTVTVTVLLVSFAEVLVFGSWLALVVVARLLVEERPMRTTRTGRS